MNPGDVLRNRYRIEKALAAGGFGETYLAIDLNYPGNPQVVVKHLKPSNKDPRTLEAAWRLLESEAKVLADLGKNSERIPTFYTYFVEQDEFYLVLEFIEGQTLTAELSDAKLTELEICQVLREILVGLQEVHSANKIHRDLKPDNIIRRAEDGKLVLIDFGSVKDVRQVSSTRTESPATRNVGTMGYSPTEQLQGFPVFASDIYAVGAIGVQCLTGQQPHTLVDRNTRELSPPNIYPKLGKILRKMLRSDHSERYDSAKEATDAIEQLLSSLSSPTSTAIDQDNEGDVIESKETSVEYENPNSSNLGRRKFISFLLLGGVGISGIFILSNFLIKKRAGKPSLSKFSFESVTLDRFGKTLDRPKNSAMIFKEDLGDGISMMMVKIPAGKFNMGSPGNGKDKEVNETPQHSVTMREFYLGQTLVTQEQWEKIMGTNPSLFKGNNKLPVDSVSWLDAIIFCHKLTIKTGRTYRLPSEAEWEYACRASTKTPFAFGETITPAIANFNGTLPYANASKGEYRKKTTLVKTFPANLFGLYDMHGNLWEWCSDEWIDNYENAPVDGRARGDVNSQNPETKRILRGGSWNYGAKSSRSADRSHVSAHSRRNCFGVRVVAV
jgi:eukaryotic-like serine/threonine-protein kinase